MSNGTGLVGRRAVGLKVTGLVITNVDLNFALVSLRAIVLVVAGTGPGCAAGLA